MVGRRRGGEGRRTFPGRNRHKALGEWETVSEVAEVEDQRRWVWNVLGPDGVASTWAYEVEPASNGAIVRQSAAAMARARRD